METETQSASTTQNCLVCKKPARENSIYCSNDCILKHASKATPSQTTSNESPKSMSAEPKQPLKNTPPPRILNALPVAKTKPQLIYDKKTNKYSSLSSAPTMEKLQKWLKEHPHCELVRPNSAQWVAWKAKQAQLKGVAKGLEAERETNSMNQPPAKVQTTLKFDADKKVILVSPMSRQSPANAKKPATPSTKTPQTPNTNRLKRPADATVTTPTPTTTPPTAVAKKRAEQPKSSTKANSNNGDSIRISVRKTLCEQLVLRTRATDNAIAKKLSDDEITEFVTATEAALFKMFGDTSNKYRAKYRSLIFNIKDRKNETLFAKISNKAIQPEQLVRMSPEELASQELAKWRENENKHQLEMITKSELDMLACAKSYVLKTHKGEEVIETSSQRVVLDPSIDAADVVSVLNSSTVSSTSEAYDAIETTSTGNEKSTHLIVKDNRYDKYLGTIDNKTSSGSSVKKSSERSKSRDRHDSGRSSSKHKRKRSRERSHRDRDRDEKRHKSRDRGRSRDRDRKDRNTSDGKRDKHKSSSSSGSKSKHRDNDKDRKREKETDRSIPAPPETKLPRMDIDLSVKIDEAQSIIDRIVHPHELKQSPKLEPKVEPATNASATSEPAAANSKKSQSNAANESDQEPSSTVTIPTPPETVSNDVSPILWSGSISMIDVATFGVSLSVIDGDPSHLVFPNELDVVGRIVPQHVCDYIAKIRSIKEIVLLRFSPTTEDDEAAYMAFVNYLDQRNRLGVIQTKCKSIKDFYILPLPAHKSLPSVLLPPDGRSIDLGADRSGLLIGIIVKTRPSAAPNRRSGLPNKVPKTNTSTVSGLPFSGIKLSVSLCR